MPLVTGHCVATCVSILCLRLLLSLMLSFVFLLLQRSYLLKLLLLFRLRDRGGLAWLHYFHR